MGAANSNPHYVYFTMPLPRGFYSGALGICQLKHHATHTVSSLSFIYPHSCSECHR
uniref:Uncharacterized protein n=1 Tax=Physcomitrium patens TaxID=3218 RepID=A0A2K1K6S6_PHYPA|nr:hypothetical protein PHYPA_011372 [Physcomitrium patens]